MKPTHPPLEVRVYENSGSIHTFSQNDPEWASRTLDSLMPTTLFSQNHLTIEDEGAERDFETASVTRIDLITSALSVWDFPLVVGALSELSEPEFMEGLIGLRRPEPWAPQEETPLFLDLEMRNGHHAFLIMQIAASLTTARLARIYYLMRKPRVVFGLQHEGVGILNLANMARFSIHPLKDTIHPGTVAM